MHRSLRTIHRFYFAAALAFSSAPVHAETAHAEIAWQSWTADLFKRAESEGKLVLLNLEAVWCHWCHVMDDKTYSNAAVIDALNEGYIAVKVDHDARPDLANRYRRYGWPATVVFTPEGREITKQRGFIAPERLLHILSESPRYADRPLDRPPASTPSRAFTPQLAAKLLQRHEARIDDVRGGYRNVQKYVEEDSVRFDLYRAQQGDEAARSHVIKTLLAARELIDPVWGGAYQYSTGGVWDQPHFEKLMRTQARYLTLYARAYPLLTREEDRRAFRATIQDIQRYLMTMMRSPEGTFYVSQDADVVKGQDSTEYFAMDDAARRRIGLPKVDTNVYSQANGRAIEGLAYVAKHLNDSESLQAALTAVAIIERTHARADGGFDHAAGGDGVVYLGDNLNMAKAYLALHDATGNPVWLQKSRQLAEYMVRTFASEFGFLSGTATGVPLAPVPIVDENVELGHFLTELAQATDMEVEPMLRSISAYLTPVAVRRPYEVGVLHLIRLNPWLEVRAG